MRSGQGVPHRMGRNDHVHVASIEDVSNGLCPQTSPVFVPLLAFNLISLQDLLGHPIDVAERHAGDVLEQRQFLLGRQIRASQSCDDEIQSVLVPKSVGAQQHVDGDLPLCHPPRVLDGSRRRFDVVDWDRVADDGIPGLHVRGDGVVQQISELLIGSEFGDLLDEKTMYGIRQPLDDLAQAPEDLSCCVGKGVSIGRWLKHACHVNRILVSRRQRIPTS